MVVERSRERRGEAAQTCVLGHLTDVLADLQDTSIYTSRSDNLFYRRIATLKRLDIRANIKISRVITSEYRC